MPTDKDSSTPLIILGMHRSGTSLTANWIQQCGVNLHPDASFKKNNPKGNYEDWQILKLHNSILAANQMSWDVIPEGVPIEIAPNYWEQAKKIARDRLARQETWGWKEPRTCLFIKNLWGPIFPKANFLVVYRHYREVVDSLVRREFKRQTYLRRKNLVAQYFHTRVQYPYFRKRMGKKWLKLWISYNQSILDFLDQQPSEQYIVCSIENLKSRDDALAKVIKENFQPVGWKYVPLHTVYEQQLMKKDDLPEYSFGPKLKAKADSILSRLQEKSIELT
jgi:hypothetical protein